MTHQKIFLSCLCLGLVVRHQPRHLAGAFAPPATPHRSLTMPSLTGPTTTELWNPSGPFLSTKTSLLAAMPDEKSDEMFPVAMTETEKDTTERKKSMTPTPVLVSAFQKLLQTNSDESTSPWNAAKSGGMVATAALALALLFSPLSADAAMSGGRMGGSFSAAPRSRSMPSRSSYGSGYSQGFRSGYGGGFSSGYYSRPSVTISPFGGAYMSPFAFPRPFFFGGPGVITYSRGPSFLDLLFVGGIGFLILSSIRSASAGINLADVTSSSSWSDNFATSALGSGTSVVQVNVALEVPNRDDRNSILSVLHRLSETARTDSRIGIQNLTSQVALELLRRKSSIISASTRYKHFNDRRKAERDFNSLAVKERGKFEQETVSKYGGVDYSFGPGSANRGGGTDQATIAVVTIMMAIDGDSTKVPTINSIQDVEEALRKIASDAKVDSCLQSAEILWTPEDRSETLTLRDVIADYPQLRSV